MSTRLKQAPRALSVALVVATVASILVLFAWDRFPQSFPARSHDVLAAFPLALIAVAYLVYQIGNRPAPWEFVKGLMLAAGFLFWAANQFWPGVHQATLFNDIAIALFVIDVLLVIVRRPAAPPNDSVVDT
jgi:multisubunit Na+/H+ antiporter MnhB subunit